MLLDKETFSKVIESTPLVSIDLIVQNEQNQILLGKRRNRPAKDYWFVPGGRILKNESLAQAFKRLTLEELGKEFDIQNAVLKGPFDHFYQDNVFGIDFSTHYVAIGYTLVINESLTLLPIGSQHDKYQWFEKSSMLNDDAVHQHTKNYFIE